MDKDEVDKEVEEEVYKGVDKEMEKEMLEEVEEVASCPVPARGAPPVCV